MESRFTHFTARHRTLLICLELLLIPLIVWIANCSGFISPEGNLLNSAKSPSGACVVEIYRDGNDWNEIIFGKIKYNNLLGVTREVYRESQPDGLHFAWLNNDTVKINGTTVNIWTAPFTNTPMRAK